MNLYISITGTKERGRDACECNNEFSDRKASFQVSPSEDTIEGTSSRLLHWKEPSRGHRVFCISRLHHRQFVMFSCAPYVLIFIHGGPPQSTSITVTYNT